MGMLHICKDAILVPAANEGPSKRGGDFASRKVLIVLQVFCQTTRAACGENLTTATRPGLLGKTTRAFLTWTNFKVQTFVW